MSTEFDLGQRASRRTRAILAAVLLLAPIAITMIALFGGGQVRQCLGGFGCVPPEPTPTPVIGATDGLIVTISALGIVWLVVAALALRSLWSADRSRLVRAAFAAIGLVLATAAVVAVVRLVEDQGRRIAAEDAGLYALGVAIIAIPVVLAWAILTERRPASRP